MTPGPDKSTGNCTRSLRVCSHHPLPVRVVLSWEGRPIHALLKSFGQQQQRHSGANRRRYIRQSPQDRRERPAARLLDAPFIQPSLRLCLWYRLRAICQLQSVLNGLGDIELVLNVLHRAIVRQPLKQITDLLFHITHQFTPCKQDRQAAGSLLIKLIVTGRLAGSKGLRVEPLSTAPPGIPAQALIGLPGLQRLRSGLSDSIRAAGAWLRSIS